MDRASLTRRRTLGLALGFAAGFLSAGARAGVCQAATTRDLAYAMRVGGVTIADLDLRLRCDGQFANVELEMRNRGIAALFAGKNRTDMVATVDVGGDGPPRPSRFQATYIKPDRTRETELDFAPDGSLVDLVVRHRGRPQESPVPPELREPSIDPLSALLQLSDWLTRSPAPGDGLTLPLFEGRKRGDLETVYQGRGRLAAGGSEHEAHHLTAALQGLSGFEADDVLVTLPGEPPVWIDVYASLDPMPVPLVIRSLETTLTTSIELVSETAG